MRKEPGRSPLRLGSCGPAFLHKKRQEYRMTQAELKRKIESTREALDAAIAQKQAWQTVLDISRLLDCLIEEYLKGSLRNEEDRNPCLTTRSKMH